MSDFGIPPLNGEPASYSEKSALLEEALRLQNIAKPTESFDRVRLLHEGLASLFIGEAGLEMCEEETTSIHFVQVKASDDRARRTLEYALYMPPDFDFQSMSDHETSPAAALAMYEALDWTVLPESYERLYKLGKTVCEFQVDSGIGQKEASFAAVAKYLERTGELPMTTIDRLLKEKVDVLISRVAFGFDLNVLGTVLIDGTTTYDLYNGDTEREVYIRHHNIFGAYLGAWVCSDGASAADELETVHVNKTEQPNKLHVTTDVIDNIEISLPCDVLGKHQQVKLLGLMKRIGTGTRILDEIERTAISEL